MRIKPSKRDLRRNIGGQRWAQNSNRIVLIIIGFQSGLHDVTGLPNVMHIKQFEDKDWRNPYWDTLTPGKVKQFSRIINMIWQKSKS